MYPLGMTGAPKQNTGTEQTDRFDELELWIPHIKALGCNAIYIGPLFESTSHGYDTRNYKQTDRRLGSNEDFRHFISLCHENGIRVVVDGYSTTRDGNFLPSKTFRKRNGIPPIKTGTRA